MKNWNRHAPKPTLSEEDKIVSEINEHPGDREETDQAYTPRVVAILAPGPFFGRTIRPAVLVRSAQLGETEIGEIMRQPRVQAMIAASKDSFLAGEQIRRAEERGAAPISVHTSPVTVRAGDAPDQAELTVIVGQPLKTRTMP